MNQFVSSIKTYLSSWLTPPSMNEDGIHDIQQTTYSSQTLLKKCNFLLSYQCNSMEDVWKQFSSEAFTICLTNSPPATIFTWYEKLLSLTFFVKEDVLEQCQKFTPIPTDGSIFTLTDTSIITFLSLENLTYLLCILQMKEVQGHIAFTCLSTPVFIDMAELCQLILFSPITPAFEQTLRSVYTLFSLTSSQLANAI